MTTAQSLFAALAPQTPDALLALIRLFADDGRPDKIDLGVGVFRDDLGRTPVMRAVKAAEAMLLAEQTSKSYLGAEGDVRFVEQIADLVFGATLAASDRRAGVQTPGGTGALRLGAELIARTSPGATVWIGDPSWPNHAPVFRAAGLAVRMHRFYEPRHSRIDLDGMLEDLRASRPGDIVLLHGCCHNPTGASFTAAQWAQIGDMCTSRGLVPFIDLAYQGMGDGLVADASATRCLLEAVPDALLAYSCDKNFGLYRERVGALYVQAASATAATLARGMLLALSRSLWSMPPDHGAAIVRTILDSEELARCWRTELDAMRTRINVLREQLAAAHPALGAIASQRGMFALLPISTAAVSALRAEHGIYMAGNGRINLAGLRHDTIGFVAAALAPHLAAPRA